MQNWLSFANVGYTVILRPLTRYNFSDRRTIFAGFEASAFRRLRTCDDVTINVFSRGSVDIVNPFRLVSMFQRIFVLSVILSFSAPAHAQLQNENLMVTMPEGYKLGFQEKKDNQLINEMVPAGENVKDWTEMLTVQIFFGMKDATPEQFKQRLEKLWSENCDRAQSNQVAQAVERGYPMMVWIQFCPLNKQTSKPEFTLLKAIRGNDSFYLVQKAFRFRPEKDQIEQWSRYLRGVYVCDSRIADRSCPATGKP